MVESVVVKISGSLVHPPRLDYLTRLRYVLWGLVDEGFRVAVVVGGGGLARSYIDVLRRAGVGEALLDEMGIESSRLNASLLAKLLYPRSLPYPLASLREVLEVFMTGLIPVSGGFQPGQSTNAVAAVIAEALGARTLLNCLKGVEGVYSDEPSTPGARLLRRLTYRQLEDILVRVSSQRAGSYTLWDMVALSVARRSGLRIVFFDCSNPANIWGALKGEKGSIVEG
ncbi:uridylate kinase [Aeropyrum pernix]|uniref:Uridylate kinase n=1 Tax=Aeropyrum pernix TaxID=56636 RepID=A0A401HA43_AERPX|nr:UMP kinase [Aeropyrum pernix]GBF09336.1 uridylate kinase [Aeropyrum pernix]